MRCERPEYCLTSTDERIPDRDRQKAATRCHVALGSGLVPDYPGLRGREKPKLYETRESREVNRSQNDSMLWDDPVWESWKWRSEENPRWFDALMWPSTNLTKVENEEEAVHRRSDQSIPVCMQTQLFSTLSLNLPICTSRPIKTKVKKQIIFLYISGLVFF